MHKNEEEILLRNELNPIIDKYITSIDDKIYLNENPKHELIYNIIKNLDEK